LTGLRALQNGDFCLTQSNQEYTARKTADMQHWSLVDLNLPEPGYSGAVAIKDSAVSLRMFFMADLSRMSFLYNH
jgi:hypothetical protein